MEREREGKWESNQGSGTEDIERNEGRGGRNRERERGGRQMQGLWIKTVASIKR